MVTLTCNHAFDDTNIKLISWSSTEACHYMGGHLFPQIGCVAYIGNISTTKLKR